MSMVRIFIISDLKETLIYLVDLKVIKKILNVRHLFVFSLILAFFVILSGGYMVSEGYGSVCSGWPLCNGFSGLFEMPYVIHMFHRLIVLCLAIFIGFLLFEKINIF